MISIVIPLYNKEKQIKNTLQSVLNQLFQEFEIVVVDDGSTDNSGIVVGTFQDKRMRLVYQQNSGVSAARNRGIQEAKFDLIAFLDADDEWDPEYLSTQYDLFQKFPKCSIFACSYEFKNSEGKASSAIINKLPFSEENGILSNYFHVASCSHPPLWTSAVVVKKEAIQAIGGFPVGITSGEDLIVWAKLAFYYPIAYTKKVLATFILDDSHIVSNQPSRLHDETDYIANELILLYNKAELDKKSGLRKYISLWYKMRASVYLRLNDKKNVFKYSLCSLRYNCFNYKLYLFMSLALLPVKWQYFFKKQYIK